MEKTEVIRFDGVSFKYGDNIVLKNVSVRIFENEFITVVGPNGSGKTTFIKLIMGVLKPIEGTVLVYGKAPKENKNVFGYVPQIEHLDVKFPITVEEVVLGGLIRPFGLVTKKDRERVYELLEELGIIHFRKEHIFSLSGGQQQKVFLARALVSSPPILILDEPSSHIDIKGEEVITSILRKLKGKKTIIVITHDTGFVNDLTDRTLCINNRRIIEHNTTPDEVLSTLFGHSKNARRVIHQGCNKEDEIC